MIPQTVFELREFKKISKIIPLLNFWGNIAPTVLSRGDS